MKQALLDMLGGFLGLDSCALPFVMPHSIFSFRHTGLDEVYAVAINLGEEEKEIDLTSIEDSIKDGNFKKATVILATNNYEQPDKEESGDPAVHSVVNSQNFKIGGKQGVVLRLFVPENGASGLTVSLTLLCIAIARVFL